MRVYDPTRVPKIGQRNRALPPRTVTSVTLLAEREQARIWAARHAAVAAVPRCPVCGGRRTLLDKGHPLPYVDDPWGEGFARIPCPHCGDTNV